MAKGVLTPVTTGSSFTFTAASAEAPARASTASAETEARATLASMKEPPLVGGRDSRNAASSHQRTS